MKQTLRKLVGILLTVCLLVLTGVTGAFAKTPSPEVRAANVTAKAAGLDLGAYINKLTDLLDVSLTGDPASDVGDLLVNTEVYNLLIVGVDSRLNDYEGRSDAMMVLSVNPLAGKVVLTSLLRDSWVSIPGNGEERLNEAYALGGAQLLKKTIRQNYGIKIDGYVVVNFNDVIDFIDDIGGIEMKLSAKEIQYVNKYTADQNKELYGKKTNPDKITASAGTLKLNGMQALAYARVRYVGLDFGRTERQRKVIKTTLKTFFEQPVDTQVTLIAKYMQRVQTDVTIPELAFLVLVYLTLDRYETTSFALPAEGTYSYTRINGKEVIKVDFDANRALWRATVGLS